MENLRIVRGNDFYLKVPVSRIVFDKTLDGETTKGEKPMPLKDCSVVKVNLISDAYDSEALQFSIVPLHNELNYDISENNDNAKYNDLSDALGTNGVNVPANKRQSKMSVTFKRKRYTVAFSYSATEPTSGTNVHEIETDKPNIADGVYFNDELTDCFGTLPANENTTEVYWYAEDDRYAVWAITMNSNSSTYRYYYTKTATDNTTFSNISNWRNEENAERMLIVKVEGDKIDLGWYGIEVVGVFNGRDFRSYERKVFKIVENNGKSFVSGDTYEGEVSYQIDTMWTLCAQDSYPYFELDPDTMLLYQYGVVDNGTMSVDANGNLIMYV